LGLGKTPPKRRKKSTYEGGPQVREGGVGEDVHKRREELRRGKPVCLPKGEKMQPSGSVEKGASGASKGGSSQRHPKTS